MPRADQDTSHTTLLDEIMARRAETLVERRAVESHQSIGAADRMNREVAGLLRTLKASLEAKIRAKWRSVFEANTLDSEFHFVFEQKRFAQIFNTTC